MDKETMEKSSSEAVRGKIRNISRMVIIKNLETGETTNFVMHIVGNFDYLMTTKHFEDNSYLNRDPHLSGSVYFYKPGGGLVNGWKYENGRIVAEISQGTEEGLQMQSTASTRAPELKCRFVDVYVEQNECSSFIYQDPEYGLGFGVECRKVGHWETIYECEYVDVNNKPEEPWNPSTGSGSGGGGGGGYIPPIAPKAKAIFRNSSMTEENWKVTETLLDKITDTQIGMTLYNNLLKKLAGKTIILKFVDNSTNTRFNPIEGAIELRTDVLSSYLLHEMIHVLQAYTEQESWNSTQLNRELEAHLIQLIYINSLSDGEKMWWKEKTKYDSRWDATRILNKIIDDQGYLRAGITEKYLQEKIKNEIINSFRKVGYDNIYYPWLESRKGLDNFKNLKSWY